MKTLTENSTIGELLCVIGSLEEQAGTCCMESQGEQGCEEATEAQHAIRFIKSFLKNDDRKDLQFNF